MWLRTIHEAVCGCTSRSDGAVGCFWALMTQSQDVVVMRVTIPLPESLIGHSHLDSAEGTRITGHSTQTTQTTPTLAQLQISLMALTATCLTGKARAAVLLQQPTPSGVQILRRSWFFHQYHNPQSCCCQAAAAAASRLLLPGCCCCCSFRLY